MVKLLVIFLLSNTLLSANTALIEKVHSFLDSDTYKINRSFINIIFANESDFIHDDKIDSVKVITTLKENGLLQLFFKKPKKLTITFSANGNALFFTKIMNDSLRSMGYYRFITNHSQIDSTQFIWSISMESEYVTDPILLRDALKKHGCEIVDIKRESKVNWFYSIDMSGAHLKSQEIQAQELLKLHRGQNKEWWLKVDKVKKLKITSHTGNSWYPKLSFFSEKMRLLKVYRRDKKTWQISVRLPIESTYVKIGDIYTLKNLKNGIEIEAQGVR